MKRGSRYSAVISVEGQDFRGGGTWSSPRDFTVVHRAYHGSGEESSGDPIPEGRWELVVKVGDEELNRAEVVLECDER